ncbi:MAG: DUF2063 domain-containing protein [Gammaproteobacteria bacterium]
MAEETAAGTFTERQVEFAAHIRDPDRHPAPADVEDRRMQIYRDLFFNNISNFLANCFPVLRSCFEDEDWAALMRDFYRDHASRTPLFTKLSKEFLTYLAEEREPQSGDLPFLWELAHYEWVETELDMSPDPVADDDVDPEGDLLENRPVLSPLARGLSYRYAVNEIDKDHRPTEPAPAPVHFLVYRTAEEKTKFIKLNAVSARLFGLIDTRPELTGRQAVNVIVDELQHPQPDTVIEGGLAILRKWRDLGVVTGTRSE